MGKPITKFADGSYLEYAQGKFDQWCVYLTRPNQPKYAPQDGQYFQRLADWATKHNAQNLYNDFIEIYNQTTPDLNEVILEKIKTLSSKYGEDALDISIDFTIMYLGMIAEEQKENTRLGKRIKRLGVHQVLIDKISYNIAANFSRGKKWYDIAKECSSRGF